MSENDLPPQSPWGQPQPQLPLPEVASAQQSARDAPPPELIAAFRRYYLDLRDDLLQQVSELETFLGFLQQSDDLAVRVAKLEAFVGLKG
jgi:hypothetical protein